MPKYVEGFVFPVSKKNLPAYIKMAKDGARVWKKFGALEYYECQGDDLRVERVPGFPSGRAFQAMVKATPRETIWFSFIVYKSKAHRNAVNKKVNDYMGKKYASADFKDFTMPFDPKKMAKGGFRVVVAK